MRLEIECSFLTEVLLNVHLHEDECFNEYELQPENREQRKGYVVFILQGFAIC